MKKLFLLIILLSSWQINANEIASRASVEKLIELTESDKMLDAIQSQVHVMFSNMSQQMGISAQEKPKFDRYMHKVAALMEQHLDWSSFKEPIIDIYTKHFTEQEIQGLIHFYQSEIGKSMTEKMPLVMQDSMLVSQSMMQELLPKIQALAQEMQQEIEQARSEDAAE